MKLILAFLMTLTVAGSTFAASSAEAIKISQISQELGKLKAELIQAKKDRRSDAISLFISGAATAVLVRWSVGAFASAKTSGDMGAGIANGFGAMFGLAAVVPGIFAGVKGYKLVVNSDQVDNLTAVISAKELELEAAQRVLESL